MDPTILDALDSRNIGVHRFSTPSFCLGLASTLTAIGLIVVYSGRAVGRFRLAERLGSGAGSLLRFVARALPIAGAVVVSVAGLALAVEASLQLGLPHLLAGAP